MNNKKRSKKIKKQDRKVVKLPETPNKKILLFSSEKAKEYECTYLNVCYGHLTAAIHCHFCCKTHELNNSLDTLTCMHEKNTIIPPFIRYYLAGCFFFYHSITWPDSVHGFGMNVSVTAVFLALCTVSMLLLARKPAINNIWSVVIIWWSDIWRQIFQDKMVFVFFFSYRHTFLWTSCNGHINEFLLIKLHTSLMSVMMLWKMNEQHLTRFTNSAVLWYGKVIINVPCTDFIYLFFKETCLMFNIFGHYLFCCFSSRHTFC